MRLEGDWNDFRLLYATQGVFAREAVKGLANARWKVEPETFNDHLDWFYYTVEFRVDLPGDTVGARTKQMPE